MKKLLSILFVNFLLLVNAQANDPVKWNASYKSSSPTEGVIIINAVIDQGWHTYSQRPTDAGPIPTSFVFETGNSVKLEGKTEESNAHEEFVPAFEAKIFVFTGTAEFRQKVKKTDGKPAAVKCKVEYMSCNDKMCLPPKIAELTVQIQ